MSNGLAQGPLLHEISTSDELYPTLRINVMSLHFMLGRTETRALLSVRRKICARLQNGAVEMLARM